MEKLITRYDKNSDILGSVTGRNEIPKFGNTFSGLLGSTNTRLRSAYIG
jgi:hypothetical protein